MKHNNKRFVKQIKNLALLLVLFEVSCTPSYAVNVTDSISCFNKQGKEMQRCAYKHEIKG